MGIALVLAVALPPYLTAPLRARADIIDDLLDAAGDFVPQYKYLKEAYDFYGKYVAGQPVIPNVQAAINAAKTQIVAELDALAAADVTACANTVVNTFQNIQLLSQDNLQNFAIQSAGCLNLAQADIAAASDKAAIDKLGFALNTVGPLTSNSFWTQQEIGYAVARGVKIISLKMDREDPTGFIQKHQALARGTRSAEAIAKEVNTILSDDELTSGRLAEVNIPF